MASAHRTLAHALSQMRDMTLSQRMAIVLGIVLVAGSLAWLAQWAASPEMVALLDQGLDGEDLALVQSGLQALAQEYQIVGTRVLVPASANRSSILARLQQQGQMPADTSIGFGALVKESNPWISREESQRRWTVALQNQLAGVLAEFGGVRRASVHLPLSGRPKVFSRNAPPTSASVTLTMQGGEAVSRQLALAAARLISGAVPGLSLKHVNVVDGSGVPVWPGPDADAGGSGELDRRRREHELRIAEKIRSQLAFDPKVRVNVQVLLDRTSRDLESSTPSDPIEISETRESDETKRARKSEQPGVQPNVGVVAGVGGVDETSLRETSKVEKVVGMTLTSEITPAGEIKEVFAAINVSYSYLDGVHRRNNPDADPATEADIQALFESEKTKIVNQVEVLVKPQVADQVRVDWYYDAVDVGPTVQAGTWDTSFTLLQRFGPVAALALLALFSLGLVMRMARQSETGEAFGIEIGLPKDAIEAAKRAAEDIQQVAARVRPAADGRMMATPEAAAATGSEAFATLANAIPMPSAEATAAEGVLEGQEVDESAVRVAAMIDQVSTMVDEDTEAIAALVEKWAQRKS